MSKKNKNRVCPVERAGSLDNRLRRWYQNPRKLLAGYITEGMTILDIGCGPGFFSIEMAYMAGESGRVVAVDLQDGMLDIVRKKIAGTDLASRIALHRCETNRIGWGGTADFALAFYVMHEITDHNVFFREMAKVLRPGGKIYIVEPPFHVTKAEFERMIGCAGNAGFSPESRPSILFSKAVVLTRKAQEQHIL